MLATIGQFWPLLGIRVAMTQKVFKVQPLNRATFGRTGKYEIFSVNRVLCLIGTKCHLTDVTLLSGVDCTSFFDGIL